MLLQFNEELGRQEKMLENKREGKSELCKKFACREKQVCVPATGLVFSCLQKMFEKIVSIFEEMLDEKSQKKRRRIGSQFIIYVRREVI